MKLTPQQEQAARAPGSAAVLAGAGTGKTHLLTARYLHHLDTLSPLEVVAVTFTDRAAAELRARIRHAAEGAVLSPEVRAELEGAPIGTIHALAARVCRDHPREAGVPALFTVLDASAAQLLRDQLLPGALAAVPAGVFAQIPYSQLRALITELLDDPYAALRSFEASQTDWAPLLHEVREQAWAELQATSAWQDAARLLRETPGPEGDKLEDLRRGVLSALHQCAQGQYAEAATVLDGLRLTVGSKKAWGEPHLEAVKGALKTLRELVRGEPLLTLAGGAADAVLAARLPLLRDAFTAVHDHLFAVRRARGELEFADLEGCALRALRNPHVRAHYRERFKAILVDECQDTSPAQAALLRAVSEGAAVTYVGDPQQAIYGFRRAGGATSRSLQDDVVAEGGLSATLDVSFRTHGELLAVLNPAMRALLGPDHVPLQAHVPGAASPGPHLRFLTVEGAGDEQAPKHRRQTVEVGAVASEIERLVMGETLITNPHDGQVRPIRYGDIAILARTWRPLDAFHAQFVRRGLPVVHAGGGNLLDTREAKDAWAVLRVVADPSDDLALAAVLRGPFGNLTDAELHALWQGKLPHESWWAALRRSAAPEHQAARTLLLELVALREATPPDVLLQAACRTQYRERLLGQPDGQRRTADWDALLTFLHLAEHEHGTPGAAALHLRRLMERGVRVPRPPLETGDAVILTSIHRAKGMEWPVVFVVDLDGQGDHPSPAVLLDEAVGVAFLPLSFGQQEEPALLTLLQRQRQRRERQELARLLYVACTRARDRLYVTASRAGGSAYELFASSLTAAGIAPAAMLADDG